jgi:hypothetical protein
MKRSTLLISVVAIVMLLASGGMAKQDKVTLCHVPKGNPLNAHAVSVGTAAAIAHLDKHFDAPRSAAAGFPASPDCACDCWGEYVACSLELATDDPRCILDQPTPPGTCSVDQLVTCAAPLENCLVKACAEPCFPEGDCCGGEECVADGICFDPATGLCWDTPCNIPTDPVQCP